MVGVNNFKLSKEAGTPKYLVICDGGNVRSSAIASTLKLNHGREAIAVGRLYMSPETMKVLSRWADRIVLTQPHMEESIPKEYKHKITVADVGQDRWGVYINPELNSIANESAIWLVDNE